jgi:tRNA nucleotidyltransferase/poly(A) polymerase
MTTVKTMFDYAPLLTTLQAIAPEAHIAGGAVRDTILEKPIRDIDVFMKAHYLEEAAACLRSSCGYVKGRRVGNLSRILRSGDCACGQV